ncbi:MAG: hypothetical protein WCT39_06900 [Candidatus Margulisiibacteriota bacterium]
MEKKGAETMSRRKVHHAPLDTGFTIANAEERHTVTPDKIRLLHSLYKDDPDFVTLATIHADLQKILAVLTQIREGAKCR